jgi:hypothetical protein
MSIQREQQWPTTADEVELMKRIARADLIGAEFMGQSPCLWKRPIEELAARGSPVNVNVFVVDVPDPAAMAYLKAMIRRVKQV